MRSDNCRLFDNIDLRSLENGSADRLLPGARDTGRFSRHAAALDTVEARAREALREPLPTLPWSLFRLFRDTGNRRLYETPYFERRRRLADLQVCLLAGRDSDGTLLSALEDLIWAICDEYTWVLPAHLWDRDDPCPESVRLDLFACETGFYLAEILHTLGDRIDGDVIRRARERIRERILDSYLGLHGRLHWENGYNNWSAVCGGAVGATFLYEERDISRLKEAIGNIIEVLRLYIASFPEDGTCEEGAGYWSYGFGFYALFADLLRSYTEGGIDLFNDPKIHAIARFPQRLQLSATRIASFSDGGRFYSPPGYLLELLHSRFHDVFLPGGPIGGAPREKASHLLREFLWCAPDRPARQPPDAVEFFAGQEWLVVRHAPFAFAALFGNNGVSHNHNDVGSFLLVDNDREGPMDLGSGEYTRQYFGPERYDILCCGSQGHSVPIIGGSHQRQGAERCARDVRFETMPDGRTLFSGDIAPAYAIDGLASFKRSFAIRGDTAETALEDHFVFVEAPLPVTERFIGFEKPKIIAPGHARFGTFDLRFDPAFSARVTPLESDSYCGQSQGRPQAKTIKAFAVDIDLPAGVTDFAAHFLRNTTDMPTASSK